MATKKELITAKNMAQSDMSLPTFPNRFVGFGLVDFKGDYLTIHELAAIIRYQCVGLFDRDYLDGDAFATICHHKRKFKVMG